ncbi:rubrerythrin family protein [Thermococcus nautili]|uniref:Rubrerythrin n=1 Tax=Thermococcus nautili TaxID=195522 RepID=W8P4D6_9EURY|nr:rubrerythrin family protein [Thermococcus nautili]AHL22300.1 Rubrerythrin [Thermococcus nautili]CAI1493654.1 Rubrerythrin-2 [Thermococcus nautili]
MPVERAMTRKFLEDAFAGESMAHMKYLIFAEQAEKEGFPKVAKLFRAIAYAEFVHAKNHFIALGKLGKTEENLKEAIAGETFEVEEMYPVYKNAAEFQGEKEAVRSTHYALEAEKLHAELYEKAKESVAKGEDIEVGKVYICPVCGYTAVDEAPERCPVCGLPGEKFVVFE